METWFSNTFMPVLIAIVAMLLVLWPTRQGGTRLLRNWGVPEPTGPQVAEAIRYLWQRRLLYIALFLALPPLADLILPPGLASSAVFVLLVPMLLGMLVAEIAATLRPVSGVRTASLGRRTWRDLVPRWAVAVAAVLGVLAVATGVFGPARWVVLGSVALCAVVVATLLHFAARRPSSTDETVDAALRIRSARVAVGIGLGWLGVTANGGIRSAGPAESADIGAIAVLVVAVLCWVWLTAPNRRSLARAG